ncbi:beta-glucan synthesis-associated [Mycena capillaripes]|nr:beta-glucan synthesis-associated [Mycena capillaripes]
MAHARQGFKREASPNLLPKPDDWEAVPSSPVSGGLSAKFSLSADPTLWGSNLSPNQAEPDDTLHNPEFKDGKMVDRAGSSGISSRGFANIGCLVLLSLAIVGLFMGYPVASYVERMVFSTNTKGSVVVNATGQVASIGNFGLIDLDTPSEAYTIKSLYSGRDMKLVFSDEFNTDGRSFYPGDDPYWEAVDLHYWAVGVLFSRFSWCSSRERQTIWNGLVTTWQFCFTGGLVVTSATLPGTNNIHGLWPAFWTMGNLGRAGYGASLDGMWPYTYDACDVGTAPNQTLNNLPEIALTSGITDAPYNGELSYLTGQRLSRCTCPGESHPGPIHQDGSYVGRRPKYKTVKERYRNLPFNAGYVWFNTSDNLVIADPTISAQNTYLGGAYQQATSVVTKTNQKCYELLDNCFSVYGIEYISWITDNKPAWTIHQAGLAKDPKTEIDARPVPQEPLYILANLGMSTNFGPVDVEHITFPTTLSLDYVRVYQYEDQINIGCDPPTSLRRNTSIRLHQ